MTMNGIDVSSNQPANIGELVDYDFLIVKATGNPPGGGRKWNYKNECMEAQAESALKRNKPLGLYHFTYGRERAHEEADHFLSVVKPYIGKAILIVDYEGEALKKGRYWLQTMLKRIEEVAGAIPFIYTSSSVIVEPFQ